MIGTQRLGWLVICLAFVPSLSCRAEDDIPSCTDSRLKVELFAEAPEIVTPTGIDVDQHGRIWVIESNTHMPPADYAGHTSDRVLVMKGRDPTGKAETITVFKDGLKHAMSVAAKPVWLDLCHAQSKAQTTAVSTKELDPNVLTVFVATRREILLCTDLDGDLKCDQVKPLIHLDSPGNYPHNGLAGFAFDPLGNLYFGFGENLGADYKIIGSDGVTFSGGGEGGSVYRCRPDGTKLERWSTGFWNPHASCFDAFGHLFTVDNDPDSRPPCRLLHTVRGGDFGYRFRNGRKGTHPFTCWDGEIMGTLPMVSGTGEAPSGIVCYESIGLPADYRGTLLVGSWGDHRIDQFVVQPRGTSFQAIPRSIVKGSQNFRPVGLAVAPDGSLYFSDWVLKDYKIHGKGRIWRLSSKDHVSKPEQSLTPQSGVAELADGLKSPILNVRRLAARLLATTDDGCKRLISVRDDKNNSQRQRFEATVALPDYHERQISIDLSTADLSDPYVLNNAVYQIAQSLADPISPSSLVSKFKSLAEVSPGLSASQLEMRKIAMLLAFRMQAPRSSALAHLGIDERDQSVRRLAVQWIGEERLAELRTDVERVLQSEPMTTDLFMACLASLSLLDGTAPSEFEKTPPAQYMLAIATNPQRSSGLRATALRMLPPTSKELHAKLFAELLASPDRELQREAIRTLQFSRIPERTELLRGIVSDKKFDHELQTDAIAGLADPSTHGSTDGPTRDVLLQIAETAPELSNCLEAIRSLRGAALPSSGPSARNSQVYDRLSQLRKRAEKEPASIQKLLIPALDLCLGTRETMSAEQLLADLDNNSGSSESGRRTFFHVHGAGCFKCHAISGRGGHVGPDLTVIARTMDRRKLAESVLDPSKEISPQFTTWTVETTQGKTLTGMLLGEELNGDLRMGNREGEIFFVSFNDIESRTPAKTSIMPEKLHTLMTTQEFFDLIAYLQALK